MIDFVVYFSTAQHEVGYVIIEGHGMAAAEFVGGMPLPPGTYRVEGGALTPVELSPETPEAVRDHGSDVMRSSELLD